jgi:DNA polymerase V
MNDDLTIIGDDAVSVHAGFPNPALDRLGNGGRHLALDLNQLLIQHPSSTYAFHVSGHAWEAAGIFDGDIALIDRAVQPKAQNLIMAWQVGGFVICRYDHLKNPDRLWGVITTTIHQY